MATLERNLNGSIVAGARRLFSVDEYRTIAETGIFDNQRVELIQGEIVEMAPQGPLHGRFTFRVAKVLDEVFDCEHTLFDQASISLLPRHSDTEPQPDIVIAAGVWDVYSTEKASPKNILLVVEISDSSLFYDRTTKSLLYASSGISEYWIVNLVDRQLEVHRRPDASGYRETIIYKSGESVTPQGASRPVCVDEILP